jgi:hypothetical protein
MCVSGGFISRERQSKRRGFAYGGGRGLDAWLAVFSSSDSHVRGTPVRGDTIGTGKM